MPLYELSPNIQESEATGRKRSHDEFMGNNDGMDTAEDIKLPPLASDQPNGEPALSSASSGERAPSPASSELSDAGTSTPPRLSPSPQTPAKTQITQTTINSTSKPATTLVKRKKLTPAERAERDKESARQKAEKEKENARLKEEREQKAAIRAVEKAKAEAEKVAKAKERDEKRRQKEEEKKRKDDEKKRKEEEEEKKARQQRTLGSFFKVPSTPKKTVDITQPKNATPGDPSPAKPANNLPKTEYERIFKPFFIKDNTRIALVGPEMDTETREVKSKILDECIDGRRAGELDPSRFDPARLFSLPTKPQKRGVLHHPVKHIMEQVFRETEKAENAGPEHVDKIMRDTRQKLSKVPMKVISFSQDVRPPYYGTVTFKPFVLGRLNMSQLARTPTARRLPLDYDYDSEAEWQEEEEGEDLDVDDDEEEMDDEDDMDEFLDDSEDAGLSRRIFANTIEPDSTGICFENGSTVANRVIYDHRMEFMHDGLQQAWGIDPFSTEYWEPEVKNKTLKPTKITAASDGSSKMPPPPTPANAFSALTGSNGNTGGDPPKLVKSELLDDVKRAILSNKALSKVGIIDFLYHQFRDDVSRTEVKNTVELVAEKIGKGRSKEWALKSGHEIAS
ncbi:chromatin assembly complex subunit p90 [Fusarium subglutinans]|uniref:Chromatin assembly complex subunit p90 n=1 Tax=Gibberella subglutinans TaxID=42677 RepID=A0A8H5Q006_GIBSU|nr:chromatin assembly complex subunit p90 [Fusarium subglutinans]KAF5605759.1 chromatin assembly complex subunit p90 [Fusarium subglutinans]